MKNPKSQCDPPKGWRASPERRGLLAKVHIAKKELRIPDDDYREILKREFGKYSARDLTRMELEYLVDYFKSKGWGQKKSRQYAVGPSGIPAKRGFPQAGKFHGAGSRQQIEKLRERAEMIAGQIENGDRRLKGLAKKILGMDRLEWCRDVGKLRRLLAALEKIKKSQTEWD